MLVRLFVAVLMLTGHVPVSICTCAPAASPVAPTPILTPVAPSAVVQTSKSCGCRTRAKDESVSTDHAVAQSAVRTSGAVTEDAGTHAAPVPTQHDDDCPAVNPAPTASATATSPVVEVPIDYSLCAPLPLERLGSVRTRSAFGLSPRPAAGAVPLYISLLTLRN